MKTKKPKQPVIDPFGYEEIDFTPSFVVAVVLTIIAMVVVLLAFVYLVFNGAVILSQAING